MTKHNADNERIKRQYFAFLKEARRHSEPTVDASAKALDRVDQVLQGTTKAIDLPDQYSIEFPPVGVGHELVQFRS